MCGLWVGLGNFYKTRGGGNALLYRARSHVQSVYTYEDFLDFLDLEFFFNTHVKGIDLGAMNYATVKDIYQRSY